LLASLVSSCDHELSHFVLVLFTTRRKTVALQLQAL